jgi:hypothetical protein
VNDLSVSAVSDEMITPRLADFLRNRGYDVMSCHSLGRANRGLSDQDQLDVATSERRAIYTFNAADYRKLHRRWMATGREHAGIIISEDLNSDLPEMIRRLQRHLDTVRVLEQHNQLCVLRR